jgi:large subunit ribosomal protein L4
MTPPAPTAAMITGGAKAKLAADVFALPRNDALVHQVVVAELAARRQGTHSTKTRGLVAGGRAKPWRQKGTGRARQGTTRAPQWAGGGVVFGPHPRNYTGKVNKKARAKALSIALSAHAADGTLLVADAAKFDKPETKKAAGLVAEHGLTTPLVVVTGADESALEKSFRNLHRTHVVPVGTLEVAEVVWARSLVVTKSALAALEGSSE